MRVGTLLKIVVLLAATLVVAAIAVVKSVDIDRYRALAAEHVRQATGRELDLRGRFDLSLSLRPALVAEDVVLANAAGGSRPEMIKVKRIEAEVGLLPLLTGTVEIRRLVLVEPDVLLEVDADGRGNWQFETDDGPAAGRQAPPGLRVGKVRLEKAQIAWRDARDGRLILTRLDSLVMDGTSPAAPIAVTAAGLIDGHEIDLSGVVGSLAEIQNQTKSFPIKLKASTKGTVAMVDGSIARLDALDGIDLKVTVEGTEAAETARLVGVDLPKIGPFRVTGKLGGAIDRLSLADFDLAIGRRELVLVTAKGAIASLRPLQGLDVAVTADADKPAALSEPLGVALPTAAPIKLTGQLTGAGGTYRLKTVKGTIGKSDLAGEASLAFDEFRPMIAIELASAQLDLADLSAELARPAKSDLPKGEEGSAVAKVVPPVKAPERQASPDDRVIPDVVLPVDGFGRADLRLHWAVKKLISNDAVFDNFDLSIDIEDGRLTLKTVVARIADGRLTAEATIDGRTRPAAVSVTLGAEKIEAGALLKALRLTEAVSGGRADFRADLKGKGDGLRALMARLDGEVVAVFDRGVINNTYADLLAFDLLRQIAPWAPKETTTQVQCMVARFTINNGLAKSRALLFDTSNLTMGGDGTVNLASEGLDLTLVPRAKQASLVNLAVPMDVGGTFVHPTILPNKTALAMGMAGAAAGAAIMPLGVLVPLITTGTGDANPCIEALVEAKNKKPPTAKSKSQPEAVIEGLGEGIGNLFKGLTGQ